MRETVYKFYMVWEFDKEEKWLNDMAARGLALVGVSFCRYVFEESEPGEYSIRLELLEELPTHPESRKYIGFLEETGVRYIGSVMRWAYFIKRTEDGRFDLFSDYASRIRHLNRMLFLLGVLFISQLVQAASQFMIHFGSKAHSFFNLGMGCGLLFTGIVIGIGFYRIARKKRSLVKQRQIYE